MKTKYSEKNHNNYLTCPHFHLKLLQVYFYSHYSPHIPIWHVHIILASEWSQYIYIHQNIQHPEKHLLNIHQYQNLKFMWNSSKLTIILYL